jgi:hypothetical protein
MGYGPESMGRRRCSFMIATDLMLCSAVQFYVEKFATNPGPSRFVEAHAAVSNLFNLGRHLVSANHYRNLRVSSFTEWSRVIV